VDQLLLPAGGAFATDANLRPYLRQTFLVHLLLRERSKTERQRVEREVNNCLVRLVH
jgi:hypothetical protein